MPAHPTTSTVLLSVLFITTVTTVPSLATSPPPRLSFHFDLSSPPRVWFNSSSERCNDGDTPDQSLTAFRTPSGSVMAYASDNSPGGFFASSGPSLLDITRDCSAPVLKGTPSWTTDSVFPHSVWLLATHTDDGVTVYGLVHDEYHPNTTDKALCPSGDHHVCWYTTVLAVKSTDGGRSFSFQRTPSNPRAIALATPQGYVPGGSTRAQGMPNHHLVRDPRTGAFYVRSVCMYLHPPSDGTCVWRTFNVSDVSSWRGWNGTDWSVKVLDPYATPAPPLSTPVAAIVGSGLVGSGGVTFFEPAGVFISMGSHLTGAPTPGGRPIVHVTYQTSTNMTTWSDTMDAGTFPLPEPFDGAVIYPHLMDTASPSRNFDVVGKSNPGNNTVVLTFITGMTGAPGAKYPRAGVAIPVTVSIA